MKKIFKYLLSILLIGCMIFIFSGCDEEESLSSKKSKNNVTKEVEVSNTTDENNKSNSQDNNKVVKDGLYNMALESGDIELSEGDICLELSGDLITIGDGFSGYAEQGTFEIKDNKIVGTYTKVTYIDHQNDGKMTEEDIQEEFDFDILEDGSLRDNNGFGSKFGHKNFSGRIYRLVEEF